jgi:esterase FrsA
MRHQVRLSAVAASLAVLLIVAGCGATEDESAPGPPAGTPVEIDEEEWFREIRLEDWTTHGGDPAVMRTVLHRIQKATSKRENPQWSDTVIEPGPGNWITEWTTAADEAMSKADTARSDGDSPTARSQYRAAAVYFTVAAYPQHRETAREADAFRMAKDSYENAARLGGWDFERLQVPLEGGTFEAFLHLPTGTGPFPVVITSGGIDFAKTENAMLFEKHLAPAGIAMVSLDNAGFGDSQAWPADRPDMDRLYSAVIDTLHTDQRIDAKRIGALGQSYGGNTVGRLAFTDKRVKVVVSVCGPVHEALNSGTAFIDNLPPQALAALAARFNVPAEDAERMAQLTKKASLVNQGFVGKVRTDTPILALANADDPFAPISDLKRLAASSADGEVKIIEGHGHCPLVRDRNPAAADWLKRHL